MSSNKITVNGNELDISGVDVFFVFECLKNLDADKQVNLTQVAETLGYSNVASAGNRLRSMKKRYGFVNLEGRTAVAAAKAAASNGEASTNGVKTETDKANAPPKKKGRPARAKSADTNGNGAASNTTNDITNGSTNGTQNGEKKSSKRKRDDKNDEVLAGQEQGKPAKRARGRRKVAASVEPQEANNELNNEVNTEVNNGAKEVIKVNDNANEVIEVNDEDNIQPGKSVRFASLPNSSKRRNTQGSRKSATPSPTETVEPPLDMEELTETVSRIEKPADRMFLLALETIKEARRERRMRRDTPKTGLKLRFRNTAE